MYYSNKRQRSFSVAQVIGILITQIVAMIAGQQFAKFMWQFEDHVHVARLQDVCMTTLSPSFSWQYAAVFEGLGVFLCVVIDFFTPYKAKPVVRSIATLTLLWNFGYVSGLWMNPMLATMFTFRCKGHQSDWQHFLVYWVGPAVGFLLAWEFKLVLDKIVSGSDRKLIANGKKAN